MKIKYAVSDFIGEKRSIENLSEATLEGYEHLFKDFQEWTSKEGLETVQQINSRALKKYFIHLSEERKNNAVSINTKRKLLNTFFRWLVTEEILESNPVQGIKKAKEEKRIKTLSEADVNSLVSWLKRQKRRNNNFYTVRDYSIFITLLGSGIRLGELCNLNWEDIDFKDGSLKLFGKARQEQRVPLSSKLIKELALWKEYCEETFEKLPPEIFTNNKGKRLGENGVKQLFKRLAEVTGVRVSAHMLRHTYARLFITSGGSVSVLSKLLRHTSIKTTEIYLTMFSNELKEMNEEFNALNTLNI